MLYAIHEKITMILSDPIVSISYTIILLFLLFRRPKIFIMIFLFAITAAGIAYLFDKLAALGLDHAALPFEN